MYQIAATPAVVVGEGIEATATVKLTRRHVTNGDRPAVTIDVNVVAELQTQRGIMVKELARAVKTVCVRVGLAILASWAEYIVWHCGPSGALSC